MLRNFSTAALLAAFATAGFAAADEPRPATERKTGAERTTTEKQSASPVDGHVANCLMLGNQAEIAILRLAVERSQDDKIKQMAQKMIQDHEKFMAKLKPFGNESAMLQVHKGATRGERDEATSTESEKPNRDKTENAAERPNPAAKDAEGKHIAGHTEHHGMLGQRLFRIAHNEVQECLLMTTEALEKEQGRNFDQGFVAQQVGAHIGMLAKLKAVENEVSPELKEVIQEGLKTTKMHKQHLEETMAMLKGDKPQNRAPKAERDAELRDTTEIPEATRK